MGPKIAESLRPYQIIKGKPYFKVLVLFIQALIESQKVQLCAVARKVNSEAKVSSVEKRLKRFLKDAVFNYISLASWFISMMPEGKLTLSLDRTTWEIGKQPVNFLTLTAHSQGIGIPIYFTLLNKLGNSSVDERIAFMEEVLCFLPVERIRVLIGDREFIGKRWVKYLIKNRIPFCMRLPYHHIIVIRGKRKKGEDWLKHNSHHYSNKAYVYGCKVSVDMRMSRGKDGCSDPLIVITNVRRVDILKMYRERWSIEVFFQAMKSRGFEFESTHIKDPLKLKKLFAVAGIAFVICHFMGLNFHEKVQSIKIKNHGYKTNSFFRRGLDLLSEYVFRRVVKLDQVFSQFWEQFWTNIIKRTAQLAENMVVAKTVP